MNIKIPRKRVEGLKTVSIQCKVTEEKAKRFEKVREVLGGYSNQEIVELFIESMIEQFEAGQLVIEEKEDVIEEDKE